MIELVKDKSFSIKDPKFQLFRNNVMYDKVRQNKFNCAITSAKNKDFEFNVFIGFTNGSIVCLKLSKQKSLFYKHEEFAILKCKDEFRHKGPVQCLLSELVDSVSVLFSGGVDGTIKFWNTEMDEQRDNNYITSIFGHKGTILAMTFSRSRNILITSSTDMTIKFWKMKDTFDKIMNPLFVCVATIRDFEVRKKKEEEKPFWINTLSLKETDVIELYVGDTKGRINIYHYVDNSYIKTKLMESNFSVEKLNINNFNLIKTANIHSRTIIKIVHSIFDSVIYSVAFDNRIVGYNLKKDSSK
jgi:WD40 repeat protein